MRRLDSETRASTNASGRPSFWAIVAGGSGLVALILIVLTPFLPVEQRQSSIDWPQNAAGNPGSIEAPLVSYAPLEFDAEIPCAAVSEAEADGGTTTVLSTVPAGATSDGNYGAEVTVTSRGNSHVLNVRLRDRWLLSTPTSDLPDECALTLHSDSTSTYLDVSGRKVEEVEGDFRPQVVGIFTDLDPASIPGFSAHVEVDSRFSTSATALKFAAAALAVLATVLSAFACHRLDSRDGRSTGRIVHRGWWRIRPIDIFVVGALVCWHFIGAGTADDGYKLGMGRVAHESEYLANYFAYFGVPETPIGAPYDLLTGALANLWPASIFIRLPELALAFGTWFLLSREVVPRLGHEAKRSRSAALAGAAVFLAFWLPFNNGLRPEPVIAFCLLLSWVSTERAIATRRMVPVLVALFASAFAVITNPTGIVCVGALLAGARPLYSLAKSRFRRDGLLAVTAPPLAAGGVLLVAAYLDQSIATIEPMREAHAIVGPNMAWFDEFSRYEALFEPSPDGSLARRFAMIAVIGSILVVSVAAARGHGRLPGLARGPVQRLLFVVLAALALLATTPTKFTHHFGVLAGVGAALAIVASIACSPRSVSSVKYRALLFGAVTAGAALAFASSNGWWYVASYGIPWWDKPISINGVSIGSLILCVAIFLFVIAGIEHVFSLPRIAPLELALSVPVLSVLSVAVVVFELASFVKGAATQYPAFSIASSNFKALGGHTCGLADDVLVDPDPNRSVLAPFAGAASSALGAVDSTGFEPDRIDPAAVGSSDGSEKSASVGQAFGNGSSSVDTADADTGGAGNSSERPFGLDPRTVPMLGSYGTSVPEKSLTSGWYVIPPGSLNSESTPVISLAAAGRIASTDLNGLPSRGQELELEFATVDNGGRVRELGSRVPDDVYNIQPAWRDLRVPTGTVPAGATLVRVHAEVTSLRPDQWISVTPPRMPQVQTLDDYVGHDDPVLLDWLVGLQFPCQRPMGHDLGIAEMPKFRITPERPATTMTSNWQSHESGGPLGFTELLSSSVEVPTYLREDWKRDWGSLRKQVPYADSAAPARVDVDRWTRSGVWNPGPMDFGLR